MHDQLRQELRATQHAVLTGPLDETETCLSRLRSLDFAGELTEWEFDRLSLVIALRGFDSATAVRLWERILARDPKGLDALVRALDQCPETHQPQFRQLLAMMETARLRAADEAARRKGPPPLPGEQGREASRRGGGLKIVAAVVLSLLLMGGSALAVAWFTWPRMIDELGGSTQWTALDDPPDLPESEATVAASEPDEDPDRVSEVLRQTVQVVLEGQVLVEGKLRWFPLGHGTGFPVTEDHYVTNLHVVELDGEAREGWEEAFGTEIRRLRVSAVGTFGLGELRERPAEIVFKASRDHRDDLALIEVPGVRARPVRFNSVPARLGRVISVGFPGVSHDLATFLTSDEDRMDRLEALESKRAESDGSIDLVSYYGAENLRASVYRGDVNNPRLPGGYLQTDATIEGGMSGGPLLDVAGRVVGVITLSHVDADIGACIRSDHVRRILRDHPSRARIDWGDIDD